MPNRPSLPSASSKGELGDDLDERREPEVVPLELGDERVVEVLLPGAGSAAAGLVALADGALLAPRRGCEEEGEEGARDERSGHGEEGRGEKRRGDRLVAPTNLRVRGGVC